MDSPNIRGLVDTIAAGFGMLHRRLLLLLIPIGIDAFLWVGPKASLDPLLGFLRQGTEAPEAGLSVFPFQGANIVGLLAFQIPSVLGFDVAETAPALPLGAIASWAAAIPLLLIMGTTGILVGCVYLGALAFLVREEDPSGSTVVARIVIYWVRFTGLLLLVALAAALLLPALGIVLSVLGGGQAILPLLALPLFATTFYLFFVEDALFVSFVGPIDALRYGYRLLQRFFWPALGFFLLINVIVLGMAIVWGSIAANPLGLLVAIVGNAYVATGLVAAGMVFYRDRIVIIQQEQQAG